MDKYFEGLNPNINELDINLIGSEFRKSVWEIIKNIPYGSVITYKDIAKELSNKMGIKKMAFQAVGSAVGHNPISIIVPCHRVIGSNGSLTGYASGIKNKVYLLQHEKVNMDNFFIPKK